MNFISMININDEKRARKDLDCREQQAIKKDRGYTLYESLEYSKLKGRGNTILQMELLRNYLR